MNDSNHKTVLLGSEGDNELRVHVKQALEKMGAKYIDGSWGLVGSQVIETFDFAIGEERLRLESETYIGLSLTGPADLVDKLSSLVLHQT